MSVKENLNARSWLLGGLTQKEYERIKPVIFEANYSTWFTVSTMATVILAVLLIVSLFMDTIRANLPIYGIGLVIFGICTLLLNSVVPAKEELLRPLVYFMNAILMLFGLLIGTVGSPELPAVTFMVMLVGLPLLTVDKPYRMGIVLVISVVIFIIVCLYRKEGKTMQMDVLNGVIFLLVSLYVNQYMVNLRLKSYLWRIQIEQESYTDGLTRVKNKTAYIKLKTEMNQALLSGSKEPFALLSCDVNFLKKINDTLGHEEGDAFLLKNCRALCKIYDHSPVYRYGGDEFMVFLRGQDYENRDALLEQMEALSVVKKGAPLNEQISIAYGMAVYDPDNDQEFQDVYKRADAAMYEKKKSMKADRE